MRPLATRTAALAVTLAAAVVTCPAAAETVTLSVGQSIQGAINGAGDGDTIILEPGVWEQTFEIIDASVSVTIRSTNPSDPAVVAATILDGLGSLGTIAHIEGAANATRFEGLTFRNGFSETTGGAIRAMGATSLDVVDCVFHDNIAMAAGGAIYTWATVTTIERTTFTNNATGNAGSDGGAVFIKGWGGHLVRNCSFIDNLADDSGGALRKDDGGDIQITGCLFEGNISGVRGAVFMRLGAVVNIDACRFFGNIAPEGSAVYEWTDAGNVSIRNSVFQANQGWAVVNNQDALNVDSCTFAGGGGTTGGIIAIGTSATNVRNCVFATTMDMVAAGDFSVSHSLVKAAWSGAGNVQADPIFADLDGPDNDPLTCDDNDLSLAPGSPGIDAGSTVAYCGPMVDLAGNLRGVDDPDTTDTGQTIMGPVIDMGAYELQAATDPGTDPCPEDVNGDGLVDVSDLVAIILAWGICP